MNDVLTWDDLKAGFVALAGVCGMGAMYAGSAAIGAHKKLGQRVTALQETVQKLQLDVAENYAKKSDVDKLSDKIDDMNKTLLSMPHLIVREITEIIRK
jgi:hypothetical protein